MQVWASVNEADIGRLRSRAEIPVQFTVDAYPNDVFRGKIAQIRLNATMTQNVVTYTVVVSTDNSDLRLIPYLTANLQFEIEERENVLQVPQSALRGTLGPNYSRRICVTKRRPHRQETKTVHRPARRRKPGGEPPVRRPCQTAGRPRPRVGQRRELRPTHRGATRH